MYLCFMEQEERQIRKEVSERLTTRLATIKKLIRGFANIRTNFN